MRLEIDREPFRHILIPQPLAFANGGLGQHPRANPFTPTVRRAIARRQHRIGGVQSRHAIPIRGFTPRDYLPNDDPVRALGRGRVRRDTNLLHPKRLTANIAHGLLLPSKITHALVPRSTIRVPVLVPEGNAVRLRPETGFPRHTLHFLLLILVLQRHLLGLRLPTIFGVLRNGRDGEAGLLIHQNLQPLIQRLVHHVVHHTGGVTGTRRFTPRTHAIGRNPLLACTEQPIPLNQMQVHLHRFASAVPQATAPRRPRGRVDVLLVVGGREVVSVQRPSQTRIILRYGAGVVGRRVGRNLLVWAKRVVGQPFHCSKHFCFEDRAVQ